MKSSEAAPRRGREEGGGGEDADEWPEAEADDDLRVSKSRERV